MSASIKANVLDHVVISMRANDACMRIIEWSRDSKYGIVSISHDNPDTVLWDVQRKICKNLLIGDQIPGLVESFSTLSLCATERDRVIDLVSHSTSKDQVMVFDGWEIRDEEKDGRNLLREFCRQIRPLLKRVHQIRLIGCATAGTLVGRQALRAIEEETGVETWGTTTDIDLRSFSDTQFIDGFLQRHDATPAALKSMRVTEPERRLTIDEDPLDYLLGHSPGVENRPIRKMWQTLRPFVGKDAWQAPGLLLEPLLTVDVPLEDRPDALKIDVLYDWKYLRLWPVDHRAGLLVEIEHEGEVKAALLADRKRIELPTRG